MVYVIGTFIGEVLAPGWVGGGVNGALCQTTGSHRPTSCGEKKWIIFHWLKNEHTGWRSDVAMTGVR